MPELPEVEVTRRQLLPVLRGRTLARVLTTDRSYFFITSPQALEKGLCGRTVLELTRVGKYLLAELSDGQRLLLHLGMTGQLFADGAASVRLLSSTVAAALSPEHQRAGFAPDRHTHLQLCFDDGGPNILFRDVRKFGKVKLLGAGESCGRLDKLGVDALLAQGPELHAKARTRSAPIKSVLLDQSVLAGVGNIYADEALFAAGIRPGRAAQRLSAAQCERLVGEVRRVLQRSIEVGGSSISDYINPDGRDGEFQDERRVYARTGLPCLHCGTAIRRKVIAQRSSHYCPKCQS